jgi:type I restriction enzyme M protein
MGPRLRGERGQFFTPKSLVRAMVEIADRKPNESVGDPACGTGGFLAETHIYQLRKYSGQKLTGQLVGVDKDAGLARLAGALLKILSQGRAHVYNFNSLCLPEWQPHTGTSVIRGYDVILTNPPFGSKIGLKDETMLGDFDFGHVWTQDKQKETWLQTGGICSSEDPQILFLELCVHALKPGGRLGIVLPEGVFGNKQTSYVWDWLEKQGSIIALLDCPRTTFQPGTDTKTNVLFFTSETQGSRAGGQAANAACCGAPLWP